MCECFNVRTNEKEGKKMNNEKRELQKRMNERTQLFYDWFIAQHGTPIKYKRLRSCQATVIEFEDCYILQSYYTLVAGIRKDTGEEFDFLRMAYGYTATSAQHIAKFFADYGNRGTPNVWRDI